MSYTVGVKRRFFPGFKKYVVKAHDWKDFRFLLNLENGEQVQIPGFRCPAFKVCADFWIHHAQGQERIRERQAVNTVEFRGVSKPADGAARFDELINVPRGTIPENTIAHMVNQGPEVPGNQTNMVELGLAPQSQISSEAQRRAANRVRSILSGEDFNPATSGSN